MKPGIETKVALERACWNQFRMIPMNQIFLLNIHLQLGLQSVVIFSTNVQQQNVEASSKVV